MKKVDYNERGGILLAIVFLLVVILTVFSHFTDNQFAPDLANRIMYFVLAILLSGIFIMALLGA